MTRPHPSSATWLRAIACVWALVLAVASAPTRAAPREYHGTQAVEAPASAGREPSAPRKTAEEDSVAPPTTLEPQARPTVSPEATDADQAPTLPRFRGRGLFIGAGILGAMAIGGGALLLASTRPECGKCETWPLFFAITVPSQAGRLLLWSSAIGMAAGGAHRRGIYDARLAASGGRWRSVRKRRVAGITTLAASLSLFGLNALARIVTMPRFEVENAQTAFARVAVFSTLMDLSMLGTAVGASLLTHTRAYARERKQWTRTLRVGVGLRNGVSLRVSGRF